MGGVPLVTFPGHTQREAVFNSSGVRTLEREAEPFLPTVAIPGFLFIHSTSVYSTLAESPRDGFWDPRGGKAGCHPPGNDELVGRQLDISSFV